MFFFWLDMHYPVVMLTQRLSEIGCERYLVGIQWIMVVYSTANFPPRWTTDKRIWRGNSTILVFQLFYDMKRRISMKFEKVSVLRYGSVDYCETFTLAVSVYISLKVSISGYQVAPKIISLLTIHFSRVLTCSSWVHAISTSHFPRVSAASRRYRILVDLLIQQILVTSFETARRSSVS